MSRKHQQKPGTTPKRWPKSRLPTAESVVDREGRTWVRVTGSLPWKPRSPGEEIVGEYVGRGSRSSGGESFATIMVRTSRGSFTVAGVVIVDLFLSSGCKIGQTVRVVYAGEKWANRGGYTFRDFELYLAGDELTKAAS